MVQILVLLPPIIAIGLALLTKEVYSSLFIGVLAGALLFVLSGGADSGFFAGEGAWSWNFNLVDVLKTTIEEISATVDSYNMGILLFLVLLGMLVALVTKAGGSKAYGEWATTKFKSKKSSLLATSALGAIIFVDDYFNCLTVGTVMSPVTDKHKVSRAKLAYIIDSTAAPICIIAPVSSWGAAVTGNMTVNNAFGVFLQTIPFNFYALLTIIFVIAIVCMNIDFGPMKAVEQMAEEGDLGNTQAEVAKADFEISKKGKVIDLILPIVVLIVGAVFGMVYTGGLFEGETIIDAFTNCDAPVSLNMGAILGLVTALVLYLPRKVITTKEYMDSLVQGFKSMVPAITILVLAWSLGYLCRYKLMLGDNIAVLFEDAQNLLKFLPAILFVLAGFIGFSTGTSWGTMGILIPLAEGILGLEGSDASTLLIICIASVAAGAVLGDHISPISDTTIMASTGAQCNHLQHVSTQIPYALTVGAVAVVAFLTAGLCSGLGYGAALGISWIVAIVALVGAIIGLKVIGKKQK